MASYHGCGYAYYKWTMDEKPITDSSLESYAGISVNVLHKRDKDYCEWLKELCRKTLYNVFIAATGQIAMMDYLIETYQLKEWVFYRQETACYNSQYPGEPPRLLVYIFKEPSV